MREGPRKEPSDSVQGFASVRRWRQLGSAFLAKVRKGRCRVSLWAFPVSFVPQILRRPQNGSTDIIENHPVTGEEPELVDFSLPPKSERRKEVHDCVWEQNVGAQSDPRWTASQDYLPEIRLRRVFREPLREQDGGEPDHEHATVKRPCSITEWIRDAGQCRQMNGEACQKAQCGQRYQRLEEYLHPLWLSAEPLSRVTLWVRIAEQVFEERSGELRKSFVIWKGLVSWRQRRLGLVENIEARFKAMSEQRHEGFAIVLRFDGTSPYATSRQVTHSAATAVRFIVSRTAGFGSSLTPITVRAGR